MYFKGWRQLLVEIEPMPIQLSIKHFIRKKCNYWWIMCLMGSHQTLWSLPLPNVTWHSGTWPYTMTPSIDQALHQFANLLPNWTILPILTLLPNFGGFHRTLQRVRLANRGRLLLRTPGPVPFGTCICSNVETILSWTCHVYGPFEFRTSLGTSILLNIPYIDITLITSNFLDNLLKNLT